MTEAFSRKIVVVTGGSSGIGLATAKKFAEQGARVVITGRDAGALEAAAADIGRDTRAIACDVSDVDAVNRLFKEVGDTFGRVDVVFANAGISRMAPFEQVDEGFFDEHFDINTKGLFFTVQAALPLISEGGSVLLCGSILGAKGMANLSVYNATKAAVRSFARTWVEELRGRSVRVNVISPGPIETPMFSKLGLSEEQVQAMGAALLPQIPLARLGQAEEIADAALFLASPNSSFVNGAELAVDGGMAQV